MITATVPIAKLSPEKRICRSIGAIWRPKRNIALSKYCEETVRLSPLHEATRGPYNLAENPFLVDILDAMTDPEVREISILKSTRVGGTMALIATLLALSDLDPAPCMVVTPDETSCTELRDRIYDTGLASPRHQSKVPAQKYWNLRAINLQTMRAYLAWAGSAQRLRGRTCRRVFFSEIDVYPPAIRGGGDPILAGSERVKRSYYSLLYYESSPDGDEDNSRITKAHKRGNQMQWWCPCPVCNHWQVPRFFPHRKGPYAGCGGVVGYRNEHGQLRSAQEARQEAHYLCEKGCRLENWQKSDFILHGKWLPKGQSINSETGEIEGDPERNRRHISCHLWTIHVPRITFADLAEGYVSHYTDNNMREFFNNWLGLPYSVGRKVPEWQVLAKRLSGRHRRGEVPKWVWFLTVGADVQMHGVHWGVYGWGHMSRVALIDWGYIQRYFGDADSLAFDEQTDLTLNHISTDLQSFEKNVLSRSFPMVANSQNPAGKTALRIRAGAMDSQYRNNSVHRWLAKTWWAYGEQGIAKDKIPRVIAVRGDDNTTRADRFRRSTVEKSGSGTKYEQPREIWNLAVSHYKEELHDRFQLSVDADHSLVLPAEMLERGQSYLQQLLNERLVEEVDKQGRKKRMWKERNNKLGSHQLDTFVYAHARADILLRELGDGITWDTTKWQNQNAQVTQPKQVVARANQLR